MTFVAIGALRVKLHSQCVSLYKIGFESLEQCKYMYEISFVFQRFMIVLMPCVQFKFNMTSSWCHLLLTELVMRS